MARVPWPTAGMMVSTGRNWVTRLIQPSRRIPAAATTTASRSSVSTFFSRVSRLPRRGTISTSGKILRSWKPRRSEPVPIRARRGMASNLTRCFETKTSRGSSRSGVTAIVSPGGSSAGTSFRLWTARSMSPRRRASSISLTKTPLPPILTRATSCMMSPFVLMTVSATPMPGFRRSIRSFTQLAWARARALPRVPILKVPLIMPLLSPRPPRRGGRGAAAPRRRPGPPLPGFPPSGRSWDRGGAC